MKPENKKGQFPFDCPLEELAEKYGTPFYLYSEDILRRRAVRFREAFEELNPLLRYSCKTNGNLDILRILRSSGYGADAISGGEVALALAAGFDPADIIMEGPGKAPEEISAAVSSGVALFSVESPVEVDIIEQIASDAGRTVSVLLRLNPDIRAGGHRYINTGRKENKFGLTAEEVEGLFAGRRERSRFLEIAGLHLHLGSQIADPEPYLAAIRRAREIFERHSFRFLDLGGGFPISYETEAPDISLFSSAIAAAWHDFIPRLVLEPGRFLVGPAGFLVTRVLYRKERSHRNFLVVDAGMNDLLRPSLYEAWHSVTPVAPLSGSGEECDVVGPVCESGDFFARERGFPGKVEPGQLLVIGEAGAYGYAMSSNYNGRPRPAEVLVSAGRDRLVRRRETMEDLLGLFPAGGDGGFEKK